MSDTSGRMSGRQFAIYDPDTHSWKMWPDIGLWGSIEYSQTWPPTGFMRDGAAFELPTSEPRTAANGCSSSPTLPTPQARDHKGRANPPTRTNPRPPGNDTLPDAVVKL